MPDFREIKLEDKVLFDKYLKPFNPEVSELTFTNFFMWRYFYRFKYSEINGLLCIISEPKEGLPYAFMPIGEVKGDNLKRTISELSSYFKAFDWKLQFKKISEKELKYFSNLTSEENIVLDIDNSDYVYLSQDLISLHGKKFDGKRNHINKFKKLYEYEYVALTEENIDDCNKIMDDWCTEKGCKIHSELYNEKLATSELLSNFKYLGCKGALIKVDQQFFAFTIGEKLNSDTAVIHIEKADSKINGLYTFINQQFLKHEWSDEIYINREQDLGIEGLRKAKLSYNPVKMIKKYTIYLG
jgi:uncharacterized protein